MLSFLSLRTEHEVFWFIEKYKREKRKERQLSFDFSASYSHMILPTCKRVVVAYQQPILSSPVKSQVEPGKVYISYLLQLRIFTCHLYLIK